MNNPPSWSRHPEYPQSHDLVASSRPEGQHCTSGEIGFSLMPYGNSPFQNRRIVKFEKYLGKYLESVENARKRPRKPAGFFMFLFYFVVGYLLLFAPASIFVGIICISNGGVKIDIFWWIVSSITALLALWGGYNTYVTDLYAHKSWTPEKGLKASEKLIDSDKEFHVQSFSVLHDLDKMLGDIEGKGCICRHIQRYEVLANRVKMQYSKTLASKEEGWSDSLSPRSALQNGHSGGGYQRMDRLKASKQAEAQKRKILEGYELTLQSIGERMTYLKKVSEQIPGCKRVSGTSPSRLP